MKTIAFHDNNLCLRGSTNAMYAYADYNEKILGNKRFEVNSFDSKTRLAHARGNLKSVRKTS